MTFGNKYRLATWCVTLTLRPCGWLHAARVQIDVHLMKGPFNDVHSEAPTEPAKKKSLGILWNFVSKMDRHRHGPMFIIVHPSFRSSTFMKFHWFWGFFTNA